MTSMHEIASEQWKTIRDGETRDLLNHRVARHGKFLSFTRLDPFVVYPPDRKTAPSTTHKIIIFPEASDIEHFVKAAEGVRAEGPSSCCEGSVGSLEMKELIGTPNFILEEAQAHFKIGKAEKRLHPRLAVKYENWRRIAIAKAMQQVRQNKGTLEVPKIALARAKWGRLNPNLKREIVETATAEGAKIEERQDGGLKISFK
ncbi:MAG: hypothetical protein V1644_03530 [Candidatus Micrarchaeota archaeon]